MKNKWMKLGMIAVVVLLLGATVMAVSAQQGTTSAGQWGWQGNSPVVAAAEALGMEQADVIAALQAGQTIADLAAEKDIPLDTIVEAVIAPRVEYLTSAVEANRLTQEEADTLLTTMRAHLKLRLSEPFTGQGIGMGMMGRGHHMGGMGMIGRGPHMGGMGMWGDGWHNGPFNQTYSG